MNSVTAEYVNGKAQKVVEKFRAYDSYEDALTDYASVIKNNPRYAPVVEASRDVTGFAHGMQKAGYATDPQYAKKRSLDHAPDRLSDGHGARIGVTTAALGPPSAHSRPKPAPIEKKPDQTIKKALKKYRHPLKRSSMFRAFAIANATATWTATKVLSSDLRHLQTFYA